MSLLDQPDQIESPPTARHDAALDRPPEGFQPRIAQGNFTRHCGPFYFLRAPEGYRQGLRLRTHHCNMSGVMHGGVMAMLADGATGRTIAEQLGEPAFTIHLEMQFLAAAKEGEWVEVIAFLRHKTGRLFFCDAEITAGEPANARLIGTARAIFSRRPEKYSRQTQKKD